MIRACLTTCERQSCETISSNLSKAKSLLCGSICSWPLIRLPVWYRVVRSMAFKNHVDSSFMTVLILRTVFLTNICIYTQKLIVKLSVIILQVSLEGRELQEDAGLNDWSRSKWEVILINPKQCPNNSSLHFRVIKQIGHFAQLSLHHQVFRKALHKVGEWESCRQTRIIVLAM